MKRPTKKAVAGGLWLALSISTAEASSVYRCEDGNGHVTFSQQGCPDMQQAERRRAYNPTPGGSELTPLGTPKAPDRQARPGGVELVVVGGKDDGCDNRVSGNDRRQAIIRKEIRAGMTRADVESALGKPDVITRSNGQTRYRYDTPGRKRTVSFDEAGCVRGSR
ncbi:DUF4124 domain-containing protein [Stutzerimonas azotifigens]|uniref:DUF4124 domain-containing protein n=1 Tax=Stutzerimonas azotifigens TaxID=291995 RepID=UPI00041E26FF|nr:DUF4124 domain-containing protein [Stutzerimonas azotifigens]